jgi:hypothetical protein
MPRLYRPTIPVEVKCRVVLRQLGELWPDQVIDANRPKPYASYLAKAGCPQGNSLGRLLDRLLDKLAELLGCNVSDLRLDHDPPLGARPQFRVGLSKTRYEPPANSVQHLIYRTKEDHRTKTLIRGEHGQYRDLALIKRARRRAKKASASRIKYSGHLGRKIKVKSRWGSRPLPSRPFPKVRRKIASRPFARKPR